MRAAKLSPLSCSSARPKRHASQQKPKDKAANRRQTGARQIVPETQTTKHQKQRLDANSGHDKARRVLEAAARQTACWRGFGRRQVAADRQIQRNCKRTFAAAPRLESREATTDARTAAQRMPRTVCASACGGRKPKGNSAAAFRPGHVVAVPTSLVRGVVIADAVVSAFVMCLCLQTF